MIRPLVLAVFAALSAATWAQPELVLQSTHPRTNGLVDVSEDGKLLVSADRNGGLRFWNASTGLLLKITDLDSDCWEIGFVPKSNVVVSAGSLGCRAVEAPSGKVLTQFKGVRGGAACLDISPNGDTVAFGETRGFLSLWDIRSGKMRKELLRLPAAPRRVRFSPDGSLLAVTSEDGVLRLVNASNGNVVGTLSGLTVIAPVAFSPSGRKLAVTQQDRTVVVASVPSLAKEAELPAASFGPTIGTIGFSSDSQLMYLVGNEVVKVSAANGEKQTTKFAKLGPLDFRLNRGRNRAILTFVDDVIKVASLDDEQVISEAKGIGGGITAVGFSNDDRVGFTAGEDGVITTWDAKILTPIAQKQRHDGQITGAKVRGSDLVTFGADGRISTSALPTLEPGPSLRVGDAIRGGDVAPDGRAWLVMSDGSVQLVDLQAKSATEKFKMQASSRTLAVSPNGEWLLAGDSVGKLFLYSISGDKMTGEWQGHVGGVTGIAWSADSKRMLTASFDGTVRTWDIGNTKPRSTTDYKLPILCAATSADRKGVGLGIAGQQAVVVSLSNGNKETTLGVGSDNARALAFSSNRKTIVSGARDGASRLFRADNGQFAARRYVAGPNEWVAIDPKGRYDGTPKALEYLHYVQKGEIIPLSALSERFNIPGLFGRRATYTPPNVQHTSPPPEPETPKVDAAPEAPVQIEAIRPPTTVRFVSPTADLNTDKPEIEITVEAANQGGGIDQVSLYQNGKRVGSTVKDLTEIPDPDAKTYSKKFRVPLAPGLNTFTATAFNVDRTKSETANPLKVTYAAKTTVGKLWIIAVAIDEYENPAYKLTYSVNDAKAFTAAISEQSKSLFSSIEVVPVYDAKANLDGIRKAFDQVAASAGPGDTFIFYYSGHGVVTKDPGKVEFYMVTPGVKKMDDGSNLADVALSGRTFSTLATRIKAQKVMVVFDACHAGSFLDGGNRLFDEKALNVISSNLGSGVAIFAGTSGYQTASEIKELKHGLFTYAMLKGLSGAALPPPSKGQKVTVADLLSYVLRTVPALVEKYGSQSQDPVAFFQGRPFPLVIAKG
ncbi:MAG: caspase family protein [Armatimonadetes bacterium]|nr:caspase family protein [Armatimonadota bacterium]